MPAAIQLCRTGPIATVTLCRPEAHNALNPAMIRELTEAFGEIAACPTTRAAILAGEGKSFCAGADLVWMRDSAALGEEESAADALALALMLDAVRACPKPVIARVHGAAFGGGAGLAAACDLVAAQESAVFCFSEVRLGLIPAVISPFVLERLGPAHARRFFLTAERIPAAEARRIGLVCETAPDAPALERLVAGWGERLLENAPGAMAECKRLVAGRAGDEWKALLEDMARRMAARRATQEAAEGMRAFLEKRRPDWHP